MARKAIHESALDGARTPREAIWKTIRDKRVFTVKDMPAKVRPRTAQTYLRGLERADYIERFRMDPPERFRPVTYRLVRDTGVEAPRVTPDGKPVTQGHGREQMWRTMARLRDFSVRDLAIHASTPEVRVSRSDTQWYVGCLAKAGYLYVVEVGGPGKPARYRLTPTRRTGPFPPMIQRAGQVWDPNLNRVMSVPGVTKRCVLGGHENRMPQPLIMGGKRYSDLVSGTGDTVIFSLP